MTRRWQFYRTASGREPVRKEIEKAALTLPELAKVQTIMDRVAEQRTRPGDVKPLRDGVLEVRVQVARRRLRLLYAESDGGTVLLALRFFQKQQRAAGRNIDLASARLSDWRSGGH